MIAGLAAAGFAQGRVALVIGNGAYRAGAALANPAADAQDLAAALRGMGFTVTLLLDGGLSAMEQALIRFRDDLAARPGAVGLFYFAGHGIQSQGVNYLLPVDQDVRSEQMLKRVAVSVQDVMAYMEEGRARVNLVFLDACRTNPFASQFRSAVRGLAVTGAAPPETLVVYSTAAGDVAEDGTGRNSPFMRALLGRIGTPGVDVEVMLRDVTRDVQGATSSRQTPYRYSSLTSGFSFSAAVAAGPVAAASTPAPGAAAAATPIRVEQGTIAWGEARYAKDLFAGYEQFLRAVESRGLGTGEVRARIDSYRTTRLFAGASRIFGLAIAATVGLLASQAEQPLSDTQQMSVLAGSVAGVVLFTGGLLFDPGVPVQVVDAVNALLARGP
jgi:uncharacterized caspase-like protein